MGRFINSILKTLKGTALGFVGTLLPLVLPFLDSLLPAPLQKVESWEAVGLSLLIGACTGILAGLKRFLQYKASLDHPR